MALSAPTQSDDGVGTHLEFPDNGLMIELVGVNGANLAQVENSLGVQIASRGNLVDIAGDPDDRGRAVEILTAAYQRLEAGKTVDPATIDGLIRMGTGNIGGGRPEPFRGDHVEIKTRKKTVEPRTQAQKAYARALYEKELVFGLGPAGTGKTYIAVAAAVNMFLTGHVDRIILSRPAVEAGERLGFLPGDMKDKVDPYMQPLYDALNDFLPGKPLGRMIDEKRIEIAPLAFMRGRTLSRAFVVLDEAQNATAMQMKMFLTRLGEGSRMVVTGDPGQVDLPKGVTSGLGDAESKLGGIPGVGFNRFTAKDVVRHHLVAKIVEAYGGG